MGNIVKVTIPLKLPSLNEYINWCRNNKYGANYKKQRIQKDIYYYIHKIPRFEKPIKIHFHWIEGDNRRDYDNICWNKKFILDTMVQNKKLKDDNRKCVCAFTDTFETIKGKWKVILEIEEIEKIEEEY